MKALLLDLIQQALQSLAPTVVSADDIKLERTKNLAHGDFTSNIAMVLAKAWQQPPRQLAEQIVAHLPRSSYVRSVEIAGPGFINFYLQPEAVYSVIETVLNQGAQFGCHAVDAEQSVLLEFVSSNPTGPLHVGHGRQAAYGDCLANLLTASGYAVFREYYVNDAGRQMAIITVSLWLRYLEQCGETIAFPANGYRGDYVTTMAQQLQQRYDTQFLHVARTVFCDLPADETEAGVGDKEAHMDALIARAKQLLGEENYELIAEFALQAIVADMRGDLQEFGVVFDQWFSEKSLTQNNIIQHCIALLQEKQLTYEQDGALWFRASQFGDEKDRVLYRKNGLFTYFTTDIAYHLNKFERGYRWVIDIFGADHHGYLPRVRAAMQALVGSQDRLQAEFIQFVSLYRGDKKVPMSTRAGSFVTLRELRQEVGSDAARFFYIFRKHEQHLDFDLELAKSQSMDNPVYYIQYAHARVCSVLRQLGERNWQWQQQNGLQSLTLLQNDIELALVRQLAKYPEVIVTAARDHAPHMLAHYLRELAHDFHSYYNAQQFLVSDAALRDARLCLIVAIRQVIANGLKILGISAPEIM